LFQSEEKFQTATKILEVAYLKAKVILLKSIKEEKDKEQCICTITDALVLEELLEIIEKKRKEKIKIFTKIYLTKSS